MTSVWGYDYDDLYDKEEEVDLRFKWRNRYNQQTLNHTGPIVNAKFTITGFDYDLPSWFRVDYYSNYCIIQDLRCDGKYCANQGKCWCDFIEEVANKGSSQAKFRLDGSAQDFIMVLNGKAKVNREIKITITFEEAPEICPSVSTITETSKTIIKWVQEDYDHDLTIYRLGCDEYITKAVLSGKTFLDYLPEKITVYKEGNIHLFEDLVCPDDGCKNKDNGKCWCEMLESLDEKGIFTFTFWGDKKDYGSVSIIVDASVCPTDQNQVNLTFRFQINDGYQSTSTTRETSLEFNEINPITKEPRRVSISSPQFLEKAKYSLDLVELPDKFNLSYYTSTYMTKSMSCDGKSCPQERPCWCRLLEQFKISSDGEVQLRIPIYSEYYLNTSNQSDYYTYWMIIMATYSKGIFHFNIKFKHATTYSYYGGSSIKEDEIWVPEGQANNPYKKFLYFDPE